MNWHYAHNGQQQGPVSDAELAQLFESGTLKADSLVWAEGMADWKPISEVPELMNPSAGGSPAPLTPVGRPAPVNQPAREYPFEFNGQAMEFFRIWIVNVVLTILTLGIYAAWAKVRTRRYFYGNTLLDGKPFDFTGNPIAILKGNLIFGGLFLLYIVVGSILPPLGALIFLGIAVLAPWLIYKALRFRAHNTVYRNVRFSFRGTPGESYAAYMGWPLLIPFTLGFIVPFVHFTQRRFYFGNMSWGNSHALFGGQVGYFYKTFFKVFAFIISMLIITSLVVPAVNVIGKRASGDFLEQLEAPTEDGASAQDGSLPNPSDDSEDDSNEEPKVKPIDPVVTTLMFASIFVFYLMVFLVGIYYNVRTTNHSINETQWGTLGRLHSKVRARDLLWLYLTNGIVVLLTVGLMIPWVKVRMARYRASKTSLIAFGDLDAVAQANITDDSAMGDAGADVFDIEIGF